MNNISIIIPCLNYEKLIFNNLEKIVNKIDVFNLKYEIIVINDGSSDNTSNEVLRFMKNNENIKLISNKINKGKSLSIISAIKECKFNTIILIDCDIPYFNYFEKVINNINDDYDLVIVNRRLKESKMIDNNLNLYQITRAKIGNLISFVINLFLKINVEGTDTQAGLKAFKKVKEFDNFNFYSKKYFFDLELIYHYTKNNKKILSVPVIYEPPNFSNIKIFSFKNFIILYEFIKIVFILKLFK